MKFSEIHILRIWEPKMPSIRRKLFLKNEIVIGSDKSADLILSGLPGFFARVNFLESSLTYFEREGVQSLEAQQIFQIGSYALQWNTVKAFKPPSGLISSSILALIGICVLGFVMGFRTTEDCADRTWSRSSEIKELRIEFRKSLQAKDVVKARAVLESLKSTISSNSNSVSCGGLELQSQLEQELSNVLIKTYLSSGDAIRAAQEFERLKASGNIESLRASQRRLIGFARDLYFEGYRLEDDEPDLAYEKMEQAREICRRVADEKNCFKRGGGREQRLGKSNE